jgi:putative drug exporter of the RND superfamily
VLATLARAATRRPLTVISLWLLLILTGFGLGSGVFERLSDSVDTVPGSESERAARFIDDIDVAGEAISAVVAGTDVSDPVLHDEIDRAVADLRRAPGVADVPDPYTTPGLAAADGRALLIPVAFSGALDDAAEEAAVDAAADRLHALAGAGGIHGADVHVSGGPLLDDQMSERAQRDVQRAELLSLPVVLLLLLLIFGGLRAAGLPLLVAVTGVAGAFLALYGFSHVTDISVYAVQVTTMLGLGLAVDCALLVVVRFREERRESADVARAVRRTVERAGPTVLFSGLTVAVSLAGLLVFPSPFLRSMGLAAAAVVVVDMLAALTLLPALLARFGARIKPVGEGEPGRGFAHVATFATRRPAVVLVTGVLALGALAAPAAGMRIAVGDARSLPADSEARQLYDTVAAHYPPGTGTDPITVVLGPCTDPALVDRVQALPGTAAVRDRTLPDGTTLVQLTPAGTVDGPAATGLVREIRDLRGTAPVQVTGTAARLVDFRAMLADRAPWAVAAVLVAIFVLLFAFTGSVLLPLRTIATTLLSLAAALGVVTLTFQDDLDALNMTAPPLVMAIAFGLAMDYELFILARMRETWLRTGDDHAAIVTGLRRSGRVVSCAALLLAVVFAAFMTGGFSPILQIGLGLTLAVLIDASLVRMFLVPATMSLLGRRAWWSPPRLRRLHERYGVRESDAGQAAPVRAASSISPRRSQALGPE